jgi:hypothetical protein
MRAIQDRDPEVVELRKASDAARRAREAIERSYGDSALIADANEAYFAKERAYQALCNSKVADIDKQIRELSDKKRSLEEAARKADALGAEQYAKKDEVAAAINANQARWAELDEKMNDLRDTARESEAYIAAQQAANKAAEAFSEAYKASEGPALEQKRNDTRSAVGQKLNELCDADADYAAAKAKSDELYQKSRELDLEIRRARKAAQDAEKN